MAHLRELAEDLGWTQLRSYLQSGNLQFQADGTAAALEAALESVLAQACGFDVPVLVLSHHPDCFDEVASLLPQGVLVLSGHTHGGQVAPFGRVLLRHSARGYHRGIHRSGGSTLYVGRGVGAAILPLRIGAAPEVVVLDWERGAERVEVRDTVVGLANAGSLPR